LLQWAPQRHTHMEYPTSKEAGARKPTNKETPTPPPPPPPQKDVAEVVIDVVFDKPAAPPEE
jgi:hypothetical protein